MKFQKFDGAGNDFVLIDARHDNPHLTQQQIARICHRRFGVGADGLMLLVDDPLQDFRMYYYNSDGCQASMCGNGGRCISAFAYLIGATGTDASGRPRRTMQFLAADGIHQAELLEWNDAVGRGRVDLGMTDVRRSGVQSLLGGQLLNTGVPHFVQWVRDLEHFDVVNEGRRLRHHPALGPEGANVNFIEKRADGTLAVRTYERGVEDETWACGTGVTASAIVSGIHQIHAQGGDLEVCYHETPEAYTEVRLIGPVSRNFTGEI